MAMRLAHVLQIFWFFPFPFPFPRFRVFQLPTISVCKELPFKHSYNVCARPKHYQFSSDANRKVSEHCSLVPWATKPISQLNKFLRLVQRSGFTHRGLNTHGIWLFIIYFLQTGLSSQSSYSSLLQNLYNKHLSINLFYFCNQTTIANIIPIWLYFHSF